MSSLIKNLRIQNFKSIRDLSLECDRINIFIGKPNAGKSNVLEAISLLGVNFKETDPNGLFEPTLRYRKLLHLFNNFNLRNSIEVTINNNVRAVLKDASENSGYDFSFQIKALIPQPVLVENELPGFFIPSLSLNLGANGERKGATTAIDTPSSVKRYEFKEIIESQKNGAWLTPPYGDNFYSIIEAYPEIRAEIQAFLKPNGLEFLIDLESQKMAVVQKSATELLSFPLHLLPDTFRRYIFHLAAIMSNRNSVLLFEEPEAHSYAPYIYQLAQHMLNDEGGNQFFLTTHNPYLLMPLMQEGKDVAVFATWFEDYQTHARRLSAEEIREMLDYGVDVFLNLDHFIPA